MPTDLERLIAIEDCKQARLNFQLALDRKDRDLYFTTVAPDLVFIPRDANNPDMPEIVMNGADAFWSFAEQVLVARKSIHLGVNPQISVIDENNATGFWYILGYGELAPEEGTSAQESEVDPQAKEALGLFRKEGDGETAAPKYMLGFESIEDEYVRIDGKWVISKILVTALATL